jgi:mycothiol synthase
MADLENRMAEPWFDPEGFFLALENKKIVGFCWTKIHHDFVNQDPIGELYVIGVDPDSHEKGVGKAVASTALNYLKLKGLNQVMLYVDADNSKALNLYESLGFN